MAIRTALGKALYGAPESVRRLVPRPWRERIRMRTGPFAPWERGYAHTPPPPVPGERAGAPDFVGIGVQKAGTTWWFGLIVAHPEVYHRFEVHKERHFFARYATEGFDAHDVARYHALFPRRTGTKTGEWTPDYVFQAWVPSLLDRAAPDARLLMIVRDPVERLLSGLAHDRGADALGGSHRGMAVSDAVERGRYADALRRWDAPLRQGRLLVLQYERCAIDPAGELARTYRFLGLDDAFRPGDMGQPASPTPGAAKQRLDPEARRRLVALYRPDVAELVTVVPDLDLALWPNFAEGG